MAESGCFCSLGHEVKRDCLCEHAVAPPPVIQPPSGHFEVLRVENDQCAAEVRTENTQWDVSSQTLEYKT
ncbi:hypothetical protein CgunFtcFv8_026049 [Champsocephalus gunnari]|uniref:Uncharacterized protein n=1 Tax=Champsocephalus gunnari TaxID=52237 RepID=A0AAN8CBZ4_CHAGU|nr:hypothetical protein CgunFtcFv8_026049 [Champsocephalus gunnari]